MAGRFPQGEFTDFVGRQDELAEIAAMLAEQRLVTIVGPGGVGKTRVSLVAAAQAAARYPDGPWIAELSGLRDAALLANTVASVLGLPQQDARSALEAVLEYLRDKRLLLILDTCEHVLDECADLIQAVLRDAPGVTVLATSRQPLDMAAEHTFPINPLPVPDSDWQPDAGTCGDAAELFALRAATAVAGFTVTADNAADVIWLCRQLDGIPLAIELAAVQLRTLPLAELSKRLDHRFSVLTGGRPGALPRHQTLRTAIEWSHELCSPAERRLWARLSVFAGDFTLPAAEEVCAEVTLERPDVLTALIGLVDKSVVLREGERYRMLDTLREFGAERLLASGELASCRARHIARYLAMARYFGDNFVESDQLDRYHELREVHANLRAALEYALEPDDDLTAADPAGGPSGVSGSPGSSGSPGAVATAVVQDRWRDGTELACSLYGYWQISGLLSEGCYWLTKALDRFAEPGHERAHALVSRGFLRSFMGDQLNSLADCEVGTAMALTLGDDPVTARGYQYMTLTLTFLGRHDEAAKVGEEARSRLRACADRPGQVMLAAEVGHLCQLSGRLEDCLTVCDEGLALLGPDNREQWLRAYLLFVCGVALFHMPDRETECEAVLRQALHGKQELGDVIGMGYTLDVLGWLSMKKGTPARTAWLLGAADPLWERGGSVRFSGTVIMEEVHQQSAGAARIQLGAERYDAEYEAGAAYVRRLLDGRTAGGAIRLEIP